MSDDRGLEFHWRETYFILFDSRQRPTLTQVERTLGELSNRFTLNHLTADNDGYFESLTLTAPQDSVALEISYESGDAVVEQGTELAKQLQADAGPEQLADLLRADARLDVMHFELLDQNDPYAGGDDDEDDLDSLVDPSCLLLVVDALVHLTHGVPIDPASGAILP